MSDRNQNKLNPLDNSPEDGNYKYRGPKRGLVKQIGIPAAMNDRGQTQAQINATPLNWSDTFPSAGGATRPAAKPAPAAPQTADQQFRSEFASRKSPTAPVTAPRPLTPPPSSAIAHNEPNRIDPLAPVRTEYGTVTPIHRAPSISPNWQAEIIKAHPQIGIKGTPENTAFVAAFNQHGAPERGMSTAQEVMQQFPTQQGPSVAGAHDDLNGRAPLPGEGLGDAPVPVANEAPATGGYSTPTTPQPAPAQQIASAPIDPISNTPAAPPPQKDQFGNVIPAWKGDFNSAVNKGIAGIYHAGQNVGRGIIGAAQTPFRALAGGIDQNVSGGPTLARAAARVGGIPTPPAKPRDRLNPLANR